MPKQPCPIRAECGLQRNLGMKAALQVWQSFYCEGSWERCERHKLAGTGRCVPDRLLPNGRLLDSPTEMNVVVSRQERAA